MDGGPIFIGGLSFSGKTDLRLMLATHPNIAMSRRTYMWTRFYDRYGDLSRPENFERCLNAMLRHKHTHMLQPDPDRIRREFWQGPPTYARLFALFHEHYAERLGRSRWGDQLGFVERYVDPIFTAYPTAKMIHMIRDPRDRLEASLPHSPHRVGKTGWNTAKWLHSVGLAERNRQRYPERYQLVRYETLMARREETLRDVCAFIGEDFVPAMLDPEGTIPIGVKESKVLVDAQPKSASASPSEQPASNLVSSREVVFVQTVARREMLAHHYRQERMQFSLHERLLYWLVDWPVNLAGMTAWRALDATPFARD